MKLYTKGGDKGRTSLADGSRVEKTDARIEAYGTIDELSAQIGVLRLHASPTTQTQLIAIQRHLFAIGSLLAGVDAPRAMPDAEAVTWLEGLIDANEAEGGSFQGFILPGGSPAAAQAHVCRTVTRRAERRLYGIEQETVTTAHQYLNRLSDYFFSLAKIENELAKIEEIYY